MRRRRYLDSRHPTPFATFARLCCSPTSLSTSHSPPQLTHHHVLPLSPPPTPPVPPRLSLTLDPLFKSSSLLLLPRLHLRPPPYVPPHLSLSLSSPLTFLERAVSSSPPEGGKLVLPSYFVPRTGSNQLPVYGDVKSGGARFLTVVRKVDGDLKVSRSAVTLGTCSFLPPSMPLPPLPPYDPHIKHQPHHPQNLANVPSLPSRPCRKNSHLISPKPTVSPNSPRVKSYCEGTG